MLSPLAPLESPYVHALRSPRRVAHPEPAAAAAFVHAMPGTPASVAAVPPARATPSNLDLLRDQYAEERMHRSVAEYQPATSQHDAAYWGSVDALLPLQPYRVAQGNPPVESFGAMLAPMLRRLDVPRIESAGLDDGFESARQRRRAAHWP